MKELGQYLKEHRLLNGISLGEAADDLKIKESELENLESGNTRAFKDIYLVKEYVKIYAKYLGLDYKEVVKEFNDFLFEHTSKISLDDIIEAEKKQKAKENDIKSPYTIDRKSKINFWPYCIGVLLVIILTLIIYVIITLPDKITNKKVNTELKSINMEENYEFTE